MKIWTCTQCGTDVTSGLVSSIGGRPDECDVCGNDTFEDPVTMGTIHSTIDRVRH